MRIYTRSESQSLVIGQHVIVTVLQVFPDRVRLGIRMQNDGRGGPPDDFAEPGEPSYWETELYLQEDANQEHVELELSFQ